MMRSSPNMRNTHLRGYCPGTSMTYSCDIHGLPVRCDTPLFAGNTAMILPVKSIVLLLFICLLFDFSGSEITENNFKNTIFSEIFLLLNKCFIIFVVSLKK